MITVKNIVAAIDKLPKNKAYNYFHKSTTTLFEIDSVTKPEGPIYIRRYDPNKGGGPKNATKTSISSEMLHRVANAIREGMPVMIDRIVGASYNNRSLLESLLAYTPQFYFCYPGRIDVQSSSTKVVRGHKHLIWQPNGPHRQGELVTIETNLTISELPGAISVYEAIEPAAIKDDPLDIEARRLHIQMQFALIKIGCGLGCRTYVAKNDQGAEVGGKKIAEMTNVITDLTLEPLMSNHLDAARSATLIDCLWLKNGKFMPAVIEVEHTTGVTTGLSRMKNFKDRFIDIQTRYIIAAPDEDRAKVLKECQKQQFADLNPMFLPFSCIHELYNLKKKGRLKGIGYGFIDNFLESAKA